jgi:hypothetical protein
METKLVVQIVLTVLMFAGFIYAGIQISKSAKEKERVLREGLRVAARVVKVEDGMARKGKNVEVLLTVEFSLPAQPPRTVRTSAFAGPVLLRDIVPGVSVHAIVDPTNSSNVIVDLDQGLIR